MGFITNLFGADDAKRAADESARGFSAGEQAYTEADERFNPYYEAGRSALADLSSGNFNAFRDDPGYRFAFDEGRRAIDSSGAARGMSLSGRQLKELNRYGTGMADQTYNNWFNRNMGLAGLGYNAANSRLNAAGGIANMRTGGADARASGYLAKAGITSGIAGGLLNVGGNVLGQWAAGKFNPSK